MYNITLLSSYHLKLGKCDSDELYNIIEKIQPEIIFEGVYSDVFDIIYAEGYNRKSLEAIAVKNYLKKYQIVHVPVDTYEINETDVFNGYDVIWDRSIEYAELFKQRLSMISQFGYSFLNSNSCAELFDKMHVIEKNVLFEMNDTKLFHQYKSYTELHDKRDIEILHNIYNYSKQHQYNNALFICGTEHRKSIMQKIQGYERQEKLKLNWSFYTNSVLSYRKRTKYFSYMCHYSAYIQHNPCSDRIIKLLQSIQGQKLGQGVP
jgi:hypothetical protein